MRGWLRIRLGPEPNQEPRCVYCGDPATTASYFPPLSWGPLGFRLLSCVECRDLIGDQWPLSFSDRVAGTKACLRKRYAAFLGEHEFNEKEIEEFGVNLKERIRLWQRKRNSVLKRLAWNAQQHISHIDHSSVFVQTFAERNFIENLKKRYFPWEKRHGPQWQQVKQILKRSEGPAS